MLEEGRYRSAGEIAEAEKVDRSYVNRVLRLTLLAPEIQEAILDGRQPKALQPGCCQARGRSSGNAFSGDSRRVAGCPERRESDIGEPSRLAMNGRRRPPTADAIFVAMRCTADAEENHSLAGQLAPVRPRCAMAR
jgi:hypothetical protein